jgi:prophage antirepressor-like protein
MKTNNQIQQFRSEEFGSLDILMEDGKPYFPATECAAVLGYRNPRKAILDHCKGVTKRDSLSGGGVQERNYIPEGDLYRLIIRSKLPAASRFEKWVFDEVLPSVRKYGAYATGDTLDELLRDPTFSETLMGRLDKERRRSKTFEELATEMAPKALYCDLVLQNKKAVPVSLIAKDYGMTAARFNEMLHRFGIQYRVAGTWLLYQKYAAGGYTQTRTYHVGGDTTVMHTCWTQKGRMFLYEFLKTFGILPQTEARRPAPLSAQAGSYI